MKELLLVLIVLACPLLMIFMMRGVHGGMDEHAGHRGQATPLAPPPQRHADQERTAALEREVARLKRGRPDHFDK